MKTDDWNWWDVVRMVLGVLIVCFFVYGGRITIGGQGKDLKADTIRKVYIDTICYYKPVPRDSVVVRYVTEKIPESVPKTSQSIPKRPGNVPDSAQVVIPIMQKVYREEAYTAYVSGYRAQLDSMVLRIPRVESIVTKQAKPKRWSVGVQAGYGIGKNGLTPYIGIGVQYRIWEF